MAEYKEARSGALQPPVSLQDIRELDRLAGVSPDLALRQAHSLVWRLARDFANLLASGLPGAVSRDVDNGPQIVQHLAGRAGTWWLGYFRWAPAGGAMK